MKRLLLLICILIQVQSMKASHVAGAELTYHCLGNGSYEVTYIFYRDCFGIQPPTAVIVSIENSCGIPAANATLSMVNPPVMINQACSQFSTCNGGTMMGIQECIYTGTIALSAQCANWTLGVSMPFRNAALTGIVDPIFNDLFVYAGINNMNNLCDNSPVFTIDPVPVVCVNQPNCLDPGGYDMDGDSLVYSLMTPLSALNQNILYSTGFSYDQPLASNPPVSISGANGELCFTASQPAATCYAILIQEYRNGELIGQVERDMILFADYCNSAQPDLSGINGTNIYDVSVCAYHPACFNIYSFDPNTSDSTMISWDHSIAAANLITSTAQFDSAFFCWTPGQSDIDTIPHCFTVFVRDNSCPANQSSSKTFCITVYDTTALCSPVSVNNMNAPDQKLLIYPQPAANHINIECGLDLNGRNNYVLTISDIFNKIIYQSKIIDKITSLNTEELFSNGVYFATIKNEHGLIIKKTKFIIVSKN